MYISIRLDKLAFFVLFKNSIKISNLVNFMFPQTSSLLINIIFSISSLNIRDASYKFCWGENKFREGSLTSVGGSVRTKKWHI